MARRATNTVDYFPHSAKSGKTIAILEGKWGAVGYAFWFKLLESLCTTENHFLDFNNPEVWQFFITSVPIDDEEAETVLALLVQLGNIDAELWTQTRRVWCQALVDNLETCYQNRRRPKPERPLLPVGIQYSSDIPTVEKAITTGGNHQSKVKESRVGELSGVPDVEAVIDALNTATGRKYKATSAHSKQILARFHEGYSVDDFVSVVKYKVSAWGNDPKMAEYLRPETLFGTKFDSYLALARAGKTVKVDDMAWTCGECGAKYRSTAATCVKCGWERE